MTAITTLTVQCKTQDLSMILGELVTVLEDTEKNDPWINLSTRRSQLDDLQSRTKMMFSFEQEYHDGHSLLSNFKGLDKQRGTYFEGLILRSLQGDGSIYTDLKFQVQLQDAPPVPDQIYSTSPDLKQVCPTSEGFSSLMLDAKSLTLIIRKPNLEQLLSCQATMGLSVPMNKISISTLSVLNDFTEQTSHKSKGVALRT